MHVRLELSEDEIEMFHVGKDFNGIKGNVDYLRHLVRKEANRVLIAKRQIQDV